MPELPEVETVCRQLKTVLPGQEILRVEILDFRLGRIDGLAGRRVEGVKRRGKFLQICISGGMTAELHLRMSGRLLWQAGGTAPLARIPGSIGGGSGNLAEGMRNETPVADYSRLMIVFPAGTLTLIDPRRFATFTLHPAANLPPLGDDPLDGLSAQRLQDAARTRRLPVKAFLMDQRLIAGIGNIYACEILFAAGIDPRRPSSDLLPVDWGNVVTMAVAILGRAVACRGTTVSDWQDLFGCGGTNQEHLEVYARQGEICRRCGGRIERIAQSGRGTWFCPSCQH